MPVNVANVVLESPVYTIVEETLLIESGDTGVDGTMTLEADKTYDVYASGYTCHSNMYVMDEDDVILGPIYQYVDALSEIGTAPDDDMSLAANWEDHYVMLYGYPHLAQRIDLYGQVPHVEGFTMTWDEAFNMAHQYHGSFTGYSGTLYATWVSNQAWLEGWNAFAPMGAGITFRVQQRAGKIFVCNVDFENGSGVVVNGVAHG